MSTTYQLIPRIRATPDRILKNQIKQRNKQKKQKKSNLKPSKKHVLKDNEIKKLQRRKSTELDKSVASLDLFPMIQKQFDISKSPKPINIEDQNKARIVFKELKKKISWIYYGITQRVPILSRFDKPLVKFFGMAKHELIHYFYGIRIFFLDMRTLVTSLMVAIRKRRYISIEAKLLGTYFFDFILFLPFIILVIFPGGEFAIIPIIKFLPKLLPSQFRSGHLTRTNYIQKLSNYRELEKISNLHRRYPVIYKDFKKSLIFYICKIKLPSLGIEYLKISKILKLLSGKTDEYLISIMTFDELNYLRIRLSEPYLANIDELREALIIRCLKIRLEDKNLHRLLKSNRHSDPLSSIGPALFAYRRGFLNSKDRFDVIKQWVKLSVDSKIPISFITITCLYEKNDSDTLESCLRRIYKRKFNGSSLTSYLIQSHEMIRVIENK